MTSRRKGKDAENELADQLRKLLDDPSIRRNIDQPGRSGHDLIGESLRHVAIEAKRVEALSVPKWLDQAETQCPQGAIPIVVHRASGEPWRAYVRLSLQQIAVCIRVLNHFRDGYHRQSEPGTARRKQGPDGGPSGKPVMPSPGNDPTHQETGEPNPGG